MRVFVTTFNVGKVGDKLKDSDLRTWLTPAFGSGDGDEGPDIVAVGMQEVIELSAALTGLVGSILEDLNARIALTLTTISSSLPSVSSIPSIYIPLDLSSHCNISLHLFYRESSLAGKIGKVTTGSVGLGGVGKGSVGRVLRLGNKGGVGVRVPIKRDVGSEGEESWETFTFINAHFAPHDENLQLRNDNYNSIVTSLLFSPSSSLDLPHTIYDTSHCFFLGDLNYRFSRLPDQKYALNTEILPGAEEGEERDPAVVAERRALVGLDTLRQEQEKGKTMLGFKEGRLEGFPPSFKRIVGRVDGYHKKRVPGWVDRIFWASVSEGPEEEQGAGLSSTIETEGKTKTTPKNDSSPRTGITEYGSLEEITISDHKPVFAHFLIPTTKSSSNTLGSSPHSTPSISSSNQTIPISSSEDRNIIALRKMVGTILDRIIGFHWLLLLTPGLFGRQARSHPRLLIVLTLEIALVLAFVANALGHRTM